MPALLGFNLGVELGQLMVVGVLLPILFAVARAMGAESYRRRVLPVGGGLLALPIAALAQAPNQIFVNYPDVQLRFSILILLHLQNHHIMLVLIRNILKKTYHFLKHQ